jgi:hypothetical protein
MLLSKTYQTGHSIAIDTALATEEQGGRDGILSLSSSTFPPDIECIDIIPPPVYILPYCILSPSPTLVGVVDQEDQDSMPAFSRFKRDPSIGAEEVVKKEKMGEKWKKLGKFGKKDKDVSPYLPSRTLPRKTELMADQQEVHYRYPQRRDLQPQLFPAA